LRMAADQVRTAAQGLIDRLEEMGVR
jgi:hypothetical protein